MADTKGTLRLFKGLMSSLDEFFPGIEIVLPNTNSFVKARDVMLKDVINEDNTAASGLPMMPILEMP